MNRIPEYMRIVEETNGLRFNFNLRKDFEEWLKKFEIDKSEICIIGSVPLHILNIRDNEDVDFIITREVEERVIKKIRQFPSCKIKNDKIYFDDEIHSHTIGKDRFDYFGISNFELINNDKYHIIVDGFKVFKLELLLSKKIREARPKDLDDVKKIEEANLIGAPGWDWDLFYSLPYWTKPKDSLYIKFRKKIAYDGLFSAIKTYFYSFFRKIKLEKYIDKIFNQRDRRQYFKTYYRSTIDHHYFKHQIPLPVVFNQILTGNISNINIFQLVDQYSTLKKESIKSMYSKDNKPLLLSTKGEVLNGTEVLLGKTWSKDYWIDIQVIKNAKNNYILKDYKYKNDKEIINENLFEILEKAGLIFYAIIWPSAFSITNDIQKYIEDRIIVLESSEYDISHDFSNLVYSFYDSDDRAKNWMLEKKINGIKNSNNKQKHIKVLKLWINDPEILFFSDKEGFMYAKETRSLKTKCRKKFYLQMDDYFYDNMIHFTESFRNNFETAKIIDKLVSQDKLISKVNYIDKLISENRIPHFNIKNSDDVDYKLNKEGNLN